MAKGSVGANTGTIINVKKKRKQWQKKGKARCTKCIYFLYGYYCDKERRSAEHWDKPKHCRWYKAKKK